VTKCADGWCQMGRCGVLLQEVCARVVLGARDRRVEEQQVVAMARKQGLSCIWS
jgi:hypothetical protein